MPNWCFNYVDIHDENPETIHLIKNQLNRPFERTYQHHWNRETNQYEPKTIQYSNPVFSFWNIKAPIDIEAYEKQTDFSSATPYSGNDWYSFNNREWGTKWDVAVSDETEYPETMMTHCGDNLIAYRFDTAWGPPTEAIVKLSNQYPTAKINLSYQEETGWGGEMEIVDGEVVTISEYENQCRDCDEINCLEYCNNDCGEICSSCNYMGEADLDAVKDCPTHSIYLDSEHVPDYRMEQTK